VKVIITGATGMVGEGVMHECLLDPDVEQVLLLSRKTNGLKHPKLTEVLCGDFLNLTSVESQLQGYDACFYCMGVSSVGLDEQQYHRITYDLTLNVAGLLAKLNPVMVFCYVTGLGTDSTEKGKSMWARVKGKTENQLMKLPFKKAYMFRPGYMQPTKGLKNANKWYLLMMWMYPVLRTAFPKHVCSLKEVGLAMINLVKYGYEKHILEVKDIVKVGGLKK